MHLLDIIAVNMTMLNCPSTETCMLVVCNIVVLLLQVAIPSSNARACVLCNGSLMLAKVSAHCTEPLLVEVRLHDYV